MPHSLPEDWRAQVTAMVSGTQDLSGAMFTGGPVLGPTDQIGVYANQYRIRLYNALEEEVVGLRALMQDGLKATLWRYLEDCPSHSWTLEHVAIRLEGWLREQGAPIEQIEMAALDRAVQEGFIAGDGRPLTVEQLATLPQLELQPPVTLLHLTTNAHRIRSRIGTEDVSVEHDQDVHLVLFRVDNAMRHIELAAPAWHLLSFIDQGLSIPDALEKLVLDGVIVPDEVASSVQQWFQDFSQHQLVQVCA